jgi:hypothetical protein
MKKLNITHEQELTLTRIISDILNQPEQVFLYPLELDASDFYRLFQIQRQLDLHPAQAEAVK